MFCVLLFLYDCVFMFFFSNSVDSVLCIIYVITLNHQYA